MRTAYFDCFSGAAGDMINAALIDAGCPLELIQDAVARLNLPGVTVATETVKRHGLAATHFRVTQPPAEETAHRHLPEIVKLIADADLPAPVTELALQIFFRLGEAEAKSHGVPVEKVHFHEVGAADAIVDIVGAATALTALGVERVIVSPIPTGHGTTECAHGTMPVPPPAVAELLRDVPLADVDEPAELCTPTGAAILTTIAAGYGNLPELRVQQIGVGAGTRDSQTRANILRVFIGDAVEPDAADVDVVTQIEAHVDDMTGQAVAYALETALAAGALDAFATPIVMKKGRPGHLLTVLCAPGEAAKLETLLFRETSTLGVRQLMRQRSKLPRERVAVDTPFGPITVKLGLRDGAVIQAWPEYDECAAAARRTGAPLSEVQQAALTRWREQVSET